SRNRATQGQRSSDRGRNDGDDTEREECPAVPRFLDWRDLRGGQASSPNISYLQKRVMLVSEGHSKPACVTKNMREPFWVPLGGACATPMSKVRMIAPSGT